MKWDCMDFFFLNDLIVNAPDKYGVLDLAASPYAQKSWCDFVPSMFIDNWDSLTIREKAIVSIFAQERYDEYMERD